MEGLGKFQVSLSANGVSQPMAGWRSIRIHLLRCAGFALVLLAQPAAAGPPFVSDDPEPTPHRQFEIYTFNNGTNTRDGTGGETGIDFNYGAGPDLQLTATLPAGYDHSPGGGINIGMSNVELAAKYRFLHQDASGLDVAVFPRVFFPSGSNRIGDNHVSMLLPVWVEKDWKGGRRRMRRKRDPLNRFLRGRCGSHLSGSAQVSDRRGAFSSNRDFRRHSRDKQRGNRLALRPERELPSAWIRQARDPEYRRDGSLFVVLVHSVHVLNEPGAGRRSGSTIRGLAE